VFDNDIETTFIWAGQDPADWGNVAGLKCDHPAQTPDAWTNQRNRFFGNRYYIPTSPNDGANYPHWTWRGDIGSDFCTYPTFQGFGQDTSASGSTKTMDGTVTIPSARDLQAGTRGALS
jgi:hypothetical protein